MLVQCSVCGKILGNRVSKTGGLFTKFHRNGADYCPGNFKEAFPAELEKK